MDDDDDDVLASLSQSLYGFTPVSFSNPGSVFTYTIKPGQVPPPPAPQQIELATPDTEPSNWSLHASSIWASSLFIADHLEDLQIHLSSGTTRVLELGAGTGLPSILLARVYPSAVTVVVSDYPDDHLMQTLSDNIHRNGVSERCRAVPHAWGTDVRPLLEAHHGGNGSRVAQAEDALALARFDVVFAADTLWNSELHAPLLDTLCACLERTPDARIHLVAGLHTGRYTIQSFINGAQGRGLVIVRATEREVDGTHTTGRPWDVSRAEGEDERERRRWVLWMIFRWGDTSKRCIQ